MPSITRFYQNLDKYLKPNKVLLIYGPRQVGKTFLIKDFLTSIKMKYRIDNGDDALVQEAVGSQSIDRLKKYSESYELIIIDEAQKIPNIGIGLKILTDQISDLKIIATGSSSFELAGQVGEPLTGRKTTLTMFPVAQLELLKLYSKFDLEKKQEDFLIYGSYPEVLTADSLEERRKVLSEIVGSYLLKDILNLDKIRNTKLLLDLLRLLAFQIGSEVSLSELGRQLGIDYKTVANYLFMFEQAFILYNLRGFSRNLRKEITKKSKYYFYDNGIRNAIIANFNPLNMRNDGGALWENFLFMERLKKRTYQNIYANSYFWRTWDQKKIDLVEEREGKLFGYEFKWGNKKPKEPAEWKSTYPDAEYAVINKKNFWEFII